MNVYSRGIVTSDEGQPPPDGLALLATDALPIYSGFSMTLVGPDGRSINERIAAIDHVNGPHRTDEYHEEHDLQALLRASAYHVTRIAELYVERNQAFEAAYDHSTTRRGNTSEPRVYYEVAAFLGSARAWFDTLLRLLWKYYPPLQGDRPLHFTEYVGKSKYRTELPVSFDQGLVTSWSSWGETLGYYRNSAMHRAPLNEWGTTCWIEPHGNRWALTVRLPSNPKADRADFDFENGVDSLDYCHASLGRLVDLAEAAVALPPIRTHLDRPRRLN